MIKDNWMTEFYGMDWYKISNPSDVNLLSGPCIVECLVNANEYTKIEKIQELGFSLVETAIEFETIIYDERETLSCIREATEKDLPEILKITEECYLTHDKFYNRFRNKTFFTDEHAKKYYFNSVINNFSGNDIKNVVVEDDKGICAYYILKKVGQLELFGKYKGIISGVTKRARGRNLHVEMQNKITELIREPYVTINRTQLGNYRVIDNHLKDHRQLSKIEHYFYKKIKK